MPQLSDDDYYSLNQFIEAVLTRVRDGVCSVGEGRSDLMQPISAWSIGDAQEVSPRMNMIREKWKRNE